MSRSRGAGVTVQDVATVESELGMALPRNYREFLLNFPPGLYRPAAETGEWSWLGPDHLMFHTHRSIVEYTRGLWDWGGLATEFLVIGTDGGGDYWCIHLREAGERVYLADHETGKYRDLNRTLQQHARWLESIE